ncbi:10466_t:CDS:2, partial [Entrophospora sp. SA101]
PGEIDKNMGIIRINHKFSIDTFSERQKLFIISMLIKVSVGFFKSDFMNEAKYVVEFFGRLTMVLSLNLTSTSDLQSPSMKEKMRTENRDTRETKRPDFALINNSGYELIMLENNELVFKGMMRIDDFLIQKQLFVAEVPNDFFFLLRK